MNSVSTIEFAHGSTESFYKFKFLLTEDNEYF